MTIEEFRLLLLAAYAAFMMLLIVSAAICLRQRNLPAGQVALLLVPGLNIVAAGLILRRIRRAGTAGRELAR